MLRPTRAPRVRCPFSLEHQLNVRCTHVTLVVRGVSAIGARRRSSNPLPTRSTAVSRLASILCSHRRRCLFHLVPTWLEVVRRAIGKFISGSVSKGLPVDVWRRLKCNPVFEVKHRGQNHVHLFFLLISWQLFLLPLSLRSEVTNDTRVAQLHRRRPATPNTVLMPPLCFICLFSPPNSNTIEQHIACHDSLRTASTRSSTLSPPYCLYNGHQSSY